MEADDISFDEEDQNIFLVDDIQLKAEALRHSILPKLEAACNHLVELIRDCYDTEVLEDSSFTLSPHFRTHNRVVDLKKNYTEAALEISGRRQEGKWPGLAKPDGTEVTIVPFGMSLVLDQSGISTIMYLSRPTYTKETFKKFFDFTVKYNEEIMALLHRAEYSFWNHYMNEFPPVTPLSTILKWSFDSDYNKIVFEGKPFSYPLDNKRVMRKVFDLMFMFPIYDSFIRISKNQPDRFLALLKKMNDLIWEADVDELVDKYQEKLKTKENDKALLDQARESAGKRIKVMPSIRWQVFQRDNWRCVACGKNADDHIWLEVDHILPRSKGGKNEITNYQTLCNVCNIGKSNKDNTDIRGGRKNTSNDN
jgi:5-methylcytosine-specific restriction endonuclease McrA